MKKIRKFLRENDYYFGLIFTTIVSIAFATIDLTIRTPENDYELIRTLITYIIPSLDAFYLSSTFSNEFDNKDGGIMLVLIFASMIPYGIYLKNSSNLLCCIICIVIFFIYTYFMIRYVKLAREDSYKVELTSDKRQICRIGGETK